MGTVSVGSDERLAVICRALVSGKVICQDFKVRYLDRLFDLALLCLVNALKTVFG